jgi:hypothetical protein
VPENWGPNFGEESWGCRLAVATETVNQWQKGAEATEAIADIKLAIIEKQDFVFIERMEDPCAALASAPLCRTIIGLRSLSDNFLL